MPGGSAGGTAGRPRCPGARGDEIVEIDEIPEEFQIRNSNAYSLAAQVARAQAGLKESVNRLSRRLLSARSRKEAARQITQARHVEMQELNVSHNELADRLVNEALDAES